MGKLNRCSAQNKVCYPTQGAAIKRALISSTRRGVALRPYFHHACKSWHLTRQKEYVNAAS